MLDFQQIADAFFEEISRLVQHVAVIGPTPPPNDEENSAFIRNLCCTPEHMTRVLEEVFWASLLTEEGRPCRPRLIYAPDQRRGGPTGFHHFEKPVPLVRERLRKLSEAHGPSGFLTWRIADGSPMLDGIMVPEAKLPLQMELTIMAPKNGALDLSVHITRLVALRAGRIYRKSQEKYPNSMMWTVGQYGTKVGHSSLIFIETAFQAIIDAGHGGSVWVVREGTTTEGLKLGYRVSSAKDMPPMMDRDWNERERWIRSVGHLACVDGAVLIDSRFRILGFGVFVNLTDKDDAPVQYHSLDEGIVERRSSQLGGGRHRSAIEFCRQYPESMAIVMSEDGRGSIITSTEHGIAVAEQAICVRGLMDKFGG